MAKIEHSVQSWKKVKTPEGMILKGGVETILIDVKILDEKVAFGRKQWLVTPVKGSGEIWVRKILN